MTDWHGYFVVERGQIGILNWQALIALFDQMGTDGSKFPAENLQKRVRLDSNAILYESLFDTEEVSGQAFRQLLADNFGIAIEDIEWNVTSESYAGFSTTVWAYSYNAILRFTVRRFGGGAGWEISRTECVGYLIANSVLWDGDVQEAAIAIELPTIPQRQPRKYSPLGIVLAVTGGAVLGIAGYAIINLIGVL